MPPGLTNSVSFLYQSHVYYDLSILLFRKISITQVAPELNTALHPADLKSGDSGAVEKCMDTKARFILKMDFGN